MAGKLGIIALESAQTAGKDIDRIFSEWRDGEHFLLPAQCRELSSWQHFSA